MKKRTLTVLVVVLVCTFLTACSKEIDTVTESVNEKESNVIKNPTVTEIIRKSNVLTDKLIWLLLRKKLSIGKDMLKNI